MTPSRLLAAVAATCLAVGAAFLPARAQEQAKPHAATVGKLVPAQQFELDNGLRVIFHLDRSDPVVAVVVTGADRRAAAENPRSAAQSSCATAATCGYPAGGSRAGRLESGSVTAIVKAMPAARAASSTFGLSSMKAVRAGS